MTFETRQSDDIEYFERTGSGPVLVLLHGIGSNAQSFAPMLPELPTDWRVIAWNAPGYGRSTPLATDWPLASDYAAAFTGFIERLGLTRFLLVGHSLGALMATSFALSHSDKISRLILTAPASGHGVAQGSVLSAASQARIDDLDRLGAEEFARTRAPRLVHDPEHNPAAVDLVRAAMAEVRMPGYGQASRMLSSGRLIEDVAKLTIRTDVVTGLGDLVVPSESARTVYRALPPAVQGDLHEVPDTGHALYLQTPAAFARILVGAMDSH